MAALKTAADPSLGLQASDLADKPETKHVVVIFNPVSGKTDPDARKKGISDALDEHGYTCKFFITTPKEDAQALTKQAVKNGADLIVVSGGDGTVVQAMSALVGSDIPIAVLPAGTGNLLSVNLGIPATLPDAVDVALSGEIYELDMARICDGKNRYFAIIGGIGLDAQIIHDADRKAKNRYGKLAYFIAALKNLRHRNHRVLIELDDKPPFRRRAKSVLLCNMGKITGGLEAMPTASPNDGLLDIGILRSETLGHWLHLIGYALLGRTQDDPHLEVLQARKITLRTASPQLIQYDGEEGGEVKEITVEIAPKAVRVLLPANAAVVKDMREPATAEARKAAGRNLLVPVTVSIFTLIVVWAIWRRKR